MKKSSWILLFAIIFIIGLLYIIPYFIAKYYTVDNQINNYTFNTLIFISKIFLFSFAITILIYENKTIHRIFFKNIEQLNIPKKFIIYGIFGKIFIIASIIIFSLYITEVISRYIIPQKSVFETAFLTGSIRQPSPYVMFKARKNGGLMKDGKEVEKFNNLGYRSDIPNRIKKSNEIRIFILGGSTVVYGWPPIPQAIQERFIKNNLPNVKVFNYGVVASVSGMELARTIYDVIDEKPDIIIFYNGGNDIMHPLGADPRPGYPYNFIVWENNPLLEPELDKYPGIPLFLYNSNILRTLCRNYFSNKLGKLENLRNEVLYNTESWRNKIADTYLNNASKCNKIAEAYNAKFLCFFQPMVYYKKTPTELEKSFIIKDNYNHALTLRNMILEKSHKIDPQLKFIDISNIFDNQTEQIFFDIIHTNQKGINIVADYIYNYLIKNFNITKNGISY